MNSLDGVRSVVVVGLGMTGLSVVRHLLRQDRDFDIKVIDTRENPPGKDQLPSSVLLCSGQWEDSWLLNADLIVASPGIALFSPSLQKAIQAGITIVGDIELFAWSVTKPVVAITGSNGKSTVTSLVGEMAKASGLSVGVGGNIGFAALDMLVNDHDCYILELSSFQLETTQSLILKGAAYLNLSEDHMDRYDDQLALYHQAKQRIFLNAECAVFNRNDDVTFPMMPVNEVVSFGFSNDSYGVVQKGIAEWLTIHGQPLMPTSEIALVGRHNVANALAALALLDTLNGDRLAACDVLRCYTGLDHRCQLAVNEYGVRWVNDSKATNVASTLAALKGLHVAGCLHLLVGGDGKGADFSELSEVLAPLNVQLYCFGRDGDQFMALSSNSCRFNTMEEAMQCIAGRVLEGDLVLLSPACASWDQFPNFMVRGEQFVNLAQQFQHRVTENKTW